MELKINLNRDFFKGVVITGVLLISAWYVMVYRS